MTKRFEKAFNALSRSYIEGTLAKGVCTACAVGNIVADAQGGKIRSIIMPVTGEIRFTCSTMNEFWSKLFITSTTNILGIRFRKQKSTDPSVSDAEYLEKLTGYTADEMAQVEYAFECNTKIKSDKYHKKDELTILKDQYNGLCAVVDLLLSFDDEVDTEFKLKLKHPKLKELIS